MISGFLMSHDSETAYFTTAVTASASTGLGGLDGDAGATGAAIHGAPCSAADALLTSGEALGGNWGYPRG